eukprot:1846407-Pyramimonas_sp.AAC.1
MGPRLQLGVPTAADDETKWADGSNESLQQRQQRRESLFPGDAYALHPSTCGTIQDAEGQLVSLRLRAGQLR